MDEIRRQTLKAQLQGSKAQLSAATSMAAAMQQANYPVGGSMVVITSLPAGANAIRMQSEALGNIIATLEKILDEI